jgi:FtsP/CotA-like multicopper oxidase with cupredoxin domain
MAGRAPRTSLHGQVVIRMPFTDYTGKTVLHCHILNHEDATTG